VREAWPLRASVPAPGEPLHRHWDQRPVMRAPREGLLERNDSLLVPVMLDRRMRSHVGCLLFAALCHCSATSSDTPAREGQQAEPSLACRMAGPRGGPDCDACLEMNCCAALDTCVADPACALALSCVATCTDPEVCPGSCFGNGAPPVTFDAVLECVIVSCSGSCTSPA
jgi:hypothetical protein